MVVFYQYLLIANLSCNVTTQNLFESYITAQKMFLLIIYGRLKMYKTNFKRGGFFLCSSSKTDPILVISFKILVYIKYLRISLLKGIEGIALLAVEMPATTNL